MNRQMISKQMITMILIAVGLIGLAGSVGCDEQYVAAGNFMEPSVAPADFSPYGYDYDMYDLFTEDI